MSNARAQLWLSMWAGLCACASPALRQDRAAGRPTRAAREPITLSVLTTNDLHGRIQQLPLLGGYVANVRRVRERDGGAVVLVDAGDIFQGTLESNLNEGAAAIRAFNTLGYAAVAVGNHEFDFGPTGPRPTPSAAGDDPLGALKARVTEARFPMLSSNLRGNPDGPPPLPGVRPSTTIEVAGIKLAIIGGITEGALTRTHPANTAGVSIAPLAASVRDEALRLRAEGVQVIIAVVHAGGECAEFGDPDDLRSCDLTSEVFELARRLSPEQVDLIVAGHTHEGIAHRVNGIAVVEAFSEGRAFGRVDMRVDPSRGVVGQQIHVPTMLCAERMDASACTQGSYEGAALARDARVVQTITADLTSAAAARARPLGVQVVAPFQRQHDGESALNNLITDLMREAVPGAQVAINNGGSVRASLPAGALTYGQLFEVFPFDNVLASVSLSAAELSAMVATNLQSDRPFLALSGVGAVARCRATGLHVDLVRKDGSIIAPHTRLKVVLSDFLAFGGDGMMREIAADRVTIHYTQLMRDALERGLARRPVLDGRDPRLFAAKHPRVRHPGNRPVRCPSPLE